MQKKCMKAAVFFLKITVDLRVENICFAGLKIRRESGGDIEMGVEKGEDLKPSVDQSSPDARRYATENHKGIIANLIRLHFFQITGFIPGHLKLFGKLRK